VTTFTITCIPTVGSQSFQTSVKNYYSFTSSGTVGEDDEEITLTLDITNDATTFTARSVDSESNVFNTYRVEESYTQFDVGILGVGFFSSTASENLIETFGWDGRYTRNHTIFTSLNQSVYPFDTDLEPIFNNQGSETTSESIRGQTTRSRSKVTTTFSGFLQTITTTTTGNTALPSATISNGTIRPQTPPQSIKGSTQSVVSSSSVRTTTESESISVYGDTASPNFAASGQRQTATVVCLATSQVGYIVTARPEFSLFLSEVAERQSSSQFTVLPSSSYVEGHMEGATVNEDNGLPMASTSEEVLSSSITLTIRINTQTEFTAADIGGFSITWPPPTRSFIRLAPTTETVEVVNTIKEFTGGDISTITTTTTETHATEWGILTWQGTHSKTETIQTSYPFEITWTYSSALDVEYNVEDQGFNGNAGFTASTAVNVDEDYSVVGFWERGVGIFAIPMTSQTLGISRSSFNVNRFVASSVLDGCALPSDVTNPALLVGPAGITINGGDSYLFGARTAIVPAGTWTLFAGGVVTASADGAGLTLFPPTTRSITAPTIANWTKSGEAVSTLIETVRQRPFLNGEGATGNKTVIINAGNWIIKNKSASETTKIESPTTLSSRNFSTDVVYYPAPLASYIDETTFGQSSRYFTSSRHTSINYDTMVPLMIGLSSVS
jgi:hypothetical protein